MIEKKLPFKKLIVKYIGYFHDEYAMIREEIKVNS